jgi:hypothetical protein
MPNALTGSGGVRTQVVPARVGPRPRGPSCAHSTVLDTANRLVRVARVARVAEAAARLLCEAPGTDLRLRLARRASGPRAGAGGVPGQRDDVAVGRLCVSLADPQDDRPVVAERSLRAAVRNPDLVVLVRGRELADPPAGLHGELEHLERRVERGEVNRHSHRSSVRRCPLTAVCAGHAVCAGAGGRPRTRPIVGGLLHRLLSVPVLVAAGWQVGRPVYLCGLGPPVRRAHPRPVPAPAQGARAGCPRRAAGGLGTSSARR